MKVAIFENEFNAIKTSFDGFNLLYFNNELKYEIFSSSQSFGDLSNLVNFSVALVDIDLSVKSHMDGFQILSQIQKLDSDKIKIIVLTGHISIREKLKSLNLPEYPIISKPINLSTIKTAFDYYHLSPKTSA